MQSFQCHACYSYKIHSDLGKSQSVFKVFGGFIGLLKPKEREEQKHEGSGEADKDQKMRRITSDLLSVTLEMQNWDLAVYHLQL